MIDIVTVVTIVAKMKRERSTTNLGKTAALNIRDFPEDLRWLCREQANRARISLREFVIASLRRATEEHAGAAD